MFHIKDSAQKAAIQRKNTLPMANTKSLSFHQNEAPKTKRHKGYKYFNKVGYTQTQSKIIPRWCTNMELLDKCVQF